MNSTEVVIDEAEKVTKEEGNLLNWGLNGIGAFFSLGMAAATICIILFGNGQRHKQQKFRIQIYSDDKVWYNFLLLLFDFYIPNVLITKILL